MSKEFLTKDAVQGPSFSSPDDVLIVSLVCLRSKKLAEVRAANSVLSKVCY
jgi:hypothetical protein